MAARIRDGARLMMNAPIRMCCFERHWGPVCNDGKVMCQLCFERFAVEDLNKVDGVIEDACKGCAGEELDEQLKRLRDRLSQLMGRLADQAMIPRELFEGMMIPDDDG